MLMSFGRLDERYTPLAKPLLCEDVQGPEGRDATRDEDAEHDQTSRFPDADKLLQQALAFTAKTAKLPRRLRWAILDRDKMEDLLGRLGRLNDNLRDMLHSHHLEVLRDQELRTGFQVIQLNSKMDQLLDIIRAGTMTPVAKAGRGGLGRGSSVDFSAEETLVDLRKGTASNGARDLQSSLVKLAQFKAVSCAVEDGQTLDDALRSRIGLDVHPSEPKSMRIAIEDLELGEPFSLSEKGGRMSASYWDDRGERHQVWIESRRLDPQQPYIPWPQHGQQSSITQRRFEALVALLRENEVTSQFRAPRCLGYFAQDPRASPPTTYGLVFENPAGVPSRARPTSLRQAILGGRRAPSLTMRVRLMQALSECVERLHAVDWLHKGLRSENVIFFPGEGDYVDLSKPFLSGFDYSRPSTSKSLSEGPTGNLADDLYRHPQVQGVPADASSGRGFRRHHDIYSLGIILTEIASWKPLETIIGVGSLGALTEKDVLGVRETLLSRSYRESLESRLGDTISRVIGNCIDANAEFAGPREPREERRDEEEGEEEEDVQAKFYATVVKQLASVHI